jgi:hypothetical protein
MACYIWQYDPFMWDDGSKFGKVKQHLVVNTSKYGVTAAQVVIDGYREGTLKITKAEYDEAVAAKEKDISQGCSQR